MDWTFEFETTPLPTKRMRRHKSELAVPHAKHSLGHIKDYVRDHKKHGHLKHVKLSGSKKEILQQLRETKGEGKHYSTRRDKRGSRSGGMPMFHHAAKKHGYMKKGGEFKPLPKSGSAEHQKIKATHEKMKAAYMKKQK